MRGRRWALALVAALPLATTEASSSDPDGDGSDQFRAFMAEDREKRATTRLGELERERRQLDRAILLKGKRYVRLVRAGLMPLSDGYDDMLGHMQRAEWLRHSLQGDLARRAKLVAAQAELEASVLALRRRRAQLAANLAEYERSREAILAARDRDAAFRRAFGSDGASEPHAAVYAAPAGRVERRAFAETKGRLPLPVPGRAEVRPVRLPDAPGPGVFMVVPDGSLVTAVFDGRVVLTGEYGELGRSVVLDHGDGYSTLSAQLGALTVEAGDLVKAGDSLGTLADSAHGNVYFEIRHQGVALDPAEWFGL